ncbi:hypothetical protein MMC17_002786 [Xylographa soralifera]|nr:hypothetical protein [Xylographa soralifera]
MENIHGTLQPLTQFHNSPEPAINTIHAELTGAKSYDRAEPLMVGEESAIFEASAADKQDPEGGERGGEVCGGDAGERGEEGLDKVFVGEKTEEEKKCKGRDGGHGREQK